MTDEVKTIKFNEVDYTEAGLKALDIAALLDLRNNVADSLGVARIKSFKDHDQAVQTAWKALDKWASNGATAASGDKPAKAAKAPKPPKEPKAPAEPAKCGFVQTVKRPTRGMFRTLTKIKEHPGKGFRVRRWDNYKDGMTLLDTAEGDEMTPLDVGYYVDNGLMSLTEPTDEAYEAGMAAWYKKHGLTDPSAAKAEQAKAKEEAKAKAAADKAEAKAKKDAEKAEVKAKKEAEAKSKADAAAKAAA